MDDMLPPAYTPREGQSVTFAEIATKVNDLSGGHAAVQFEDTLKAFETFLTSEEQTKVSKDQLRVLRSRFVRILEECARQPDIDAYLVLPNITEILNTVSNKLASIAKIENVLDDPNASKDIEELVGKAFEEVDAQLREIIQGEYDDSATYREALIKAQANDRKKIEELEGIVNQLRESRETFDQRVQELMQEQLKIIGDKSEGRPRQEDAKQALALIAELTGNSLPPSTLLDRQFVTIGKTAISQGNSYDIFLGEYFTGERIAIKVLRQRVSGDTVQKMHERFARQTMNWASLRHDSILPFYGIGVMGSPVSEGEFQLYMVSPHLQNQDVQRYLKKYEKTSAHSRLQMVYDIACGLQYMHEDSRLGKNGLVHSALNPSNILIKDSGRAVISGFGHAKIIEGFQENFTGDNPGYRYMGPEMIDESILTQSSDMWAWAMTSMEILTDEPPYGKKTKGPQIIRAVGQGRKPKRSDHPKIEEYASPDALWEVFDRCWELNPKDRPLASEIVSKIKLLIQHSIIASQAGSGKGSTISRNMSVADVIKTLGQHKCRDVTRRLDLGKCGEFAVAWGGFGDVYAGRLTNNTKVAIKYPRIILQSTDGDRNVLKAMAQEIFVWSKLKHPNILEPVGVALFRDQMCIVSLWMDNGSLSQYLASRPNVDRYQVCTQISNGLAYLHGEGITHGDIKGQNVLVSKDGVAKLTDFGNTRLKEYTLIFTGQNNDSNITLRWTSPEQLSGAGFSPPGDVYAFGMTILEAFTEQAPYAGVNEMAVFGKVVNRREIPDRPTDCLPPGNIQADRLWVLLTQCWAFDPNARPSAAETSKSLRSIMGKEFTNVLNPLPNAPVAQAPTSSDLETHGHCQSEADASVLAMSLLLPFISLTFLEPLRSLSFALLLFSALYFSLITSLYSFR